MIPARLLETMREVLEIALADDNFIDTTSGGACNPQEAAELRFSMNDAYNAITNELRMRELEDFVRKVSKHIMPIVDVPPAYQGAARHLGDLSEFILQARELVKKS